MSFILLSSSWNLHSSQWDNFSLFFTIFGETAERILEIKLDTIPNQAARFDAFWLVQTFVRQIENKWRSRLAVQSVCCCTCFTAVLRHTKLIGGVLINSLTSKYFFMIFRLQALNMICTCVCFRECRVNLLSCFIVWLIHISEVSTTTSGQHQGGLLISLSA